MDIFTTVSWDEEFPKARVALLLEHFSELSDERESQRIMYPLHEVLLLVTCATICSCGRALKKTSRSRIGANTGSFRPRPAARL